MHENPDGADCFQARQDTRDSPLETTRAALRVKKAPATGAGAGAVAQWAPPAATPWNHRKNEPSSRFVVPRPPRGNRHSSRPSPCPDPARLGAGSYAEAPSAEGRCRTRPHSFPGRGLGSAQNSTGCRLRRPTSAAKAQSQKLSNATQTRAVAIARRNQRPRLHVLCATAAHPLRGEFSPLVSAARFCATRPNAHCQATARTRRGVARGGSHGWHRAGRPLASDALTSWAP